jgi:3-deoxy-D-manno-octulosonic-acid transferase
MTAMLVFLYSLGLTLAAPFLLLRLVWRSRRNPHYRDSWWQRFGWVHVPSEYQQGIWLHAVSVGEFNAAIPLIEQILAKYPELPMTVTSTTPTGRARVQAVMGDRVLSLYLPYDIPLAINLFMRRLQPRLGILIETELWPNLLRACRARSLPLMLANARLSARSARGYRKIPGLMRAMLHSLTVIAAQGRADARRLIALGADPARVKITGSVKYDLEIPETLVQAGTALRAKLGVDRPIWLAASTHDQEEALILEAHRLVQQALPAALLILVPRHMERFNSVATLVQQTGFTLCRRTDPAPDVSRDVFLGDTMGELLLFYGACDVAFIGGSLIERGCHNMLEAAALGLPCLTGPHVFNFKEIHRDLTRAGALQTVTSPAALASIVIDWLRDPSQRQQVGQRGLNHMQANRGALQRHLSLVSNLV